jgi:hypothetical protein
MSAERTICLQHGMQFPATQLPIIVLQRIEERFPEWREITVSAMCLRAERRSISSYY